MGTKTIYLEAEIDDPDIANVDCVSFINQAMELISQSTYDALNEAPEAFAHECKELWIYNSIKIVDIHDSLYQGTPYKPLKTLTPPNKEKEIKEFMEKLFKLGKDKK